MTDEQTSAISVEDRRSELNDLLCCAICGGRMVYIRGRHPAWPRIVCPTCMAETLDDIKSRLRDDYDRACQAI